MAIFDGMQGANPSVELVRRKLTLKLVKTLFP